MIQEPSDKDRYEQIGPQIEALIKSRKRFAPGDVAVAPPEDKRMRVRKALLPDSRRDPYAFERVIGSRNLLGISYLSKGLEAARAVCRIEIRTVTGARDGYATGFLVAPGLLLTNRHVLTNAAVARSSLAEFDYSLDHNMIELPSRLFQLLPQRLFFSDPDLDYAFVAVALHATDGTPLREFGYLPLIPSSGKAVDGEAVSIIQHPMGEPKQIVLRENHVVTLPEDQAPGRFRDYIHYTADTERGSSGAPVFNDQWQVVALHHMSIAQRDESGRILARDGTPWEASRGDEEKAWIANEGIRISRIFRSLARNSSRDGRARAVLSKLTVPGPDYGAARTQILSREIGPDAPPFEAARFEGATGYDPSFLSIDLPLPTLSPALAADATQRLDGSGPELQYHHFSVVMSQSRRLALFAAVNIDGGALVATSDDKSWRTDSRIEDVFQSDNRLYKYNPLDRGHLVRRLDPVWGANAMKALADTFHYTNAAPQEHGFNDGIWGDLEDLILERARETDHKVSVITGAVFTDDDGFYGSDREGGPYQLPARYWKVVVFMKPGDVTSASSYILSQSDDIAALIERMSPEEARTHQVEIAEIEALTGLDFGTLKQSDTFSGVERTERRNLITCAEDLIL
jgi:endonuclease G